MSDVLSVDPSTVSRASIVQLLEGLGLTGRLVAESGGFQLGWADFIDGRPVAAQVGAIDGLDALTDLLVIDVGRIRFVGADRPSGSQVPEPLADVLGLVMNGCRLRDEFERMKPLVVALKGPLPDDASAPVRAVAAQIDGQTPLSEAIAKASASPTQVLDELRAWFESDTVTRVATASPPTPPVDFYEAVASGRRNFHDGDLERAEADLMWAVAQRPSDAVARQNLARVREVRARQWIERIPRTRGS